MLESNELLNIKQASAWATEHIGKTVTTSNIAYLINYDRVPKIVALEKKQLKQVQADYAKGIAYVLRNARKFLAEDFDIFLVANDKYNL